MKRYWPAGLLFLMVLGVVAWPFLKHSPSPASAEDAEEHSPRLMVHLLDYLAADYGGAVKNGKVLSLPEYKEQLEFAKTVLDLSQSLPEMKASPLVQTEMMKLEDLIHGKGDPAQVAATARKIQAEVMRIARFPVAPEKWPDLLSGKRLFEVNCTKCHGAEGKGNGYAAATLNPKPTSFLSAKMRDLAPLQAFNTIHLGVPGTGMAAFPNFSDQDTWNLAFYVLSLRYQEWLSRSDRVYGLSVEPPGEVLKLSKGDLLKKVAVTSDSDLEKDLSGAKENPAGLLADLRLHSFNGSAQASLDLARLYLEDAFRDYKKGSFDPASRKALRAYLEGVEPVEPRLKANDPQVVLDLEQYMGLVRSGINGKKPVPEVETAVQKALGSLQAAANLLKDKAPSSGLTFTLSFGILLREGFEALLLIVTLLGIIRASGAKKARRWVHGGWLAAVALGFVAWIFSGWLMGLSGLGRELMEGLTGALTVVILLYIGFWLHSKTEITRWKSFIQVQVRSALEERNLIQLAFISFLAAFREVIETVLFLRAIWLEGGSETKLALGGGVAAAFAAILLLGWLLLAFSARIPIKTLFNVSSIIMVALAFILTGKAVHSFQEADIVSITLSPLNLHWDWLGLYPTRETILFQLAILALSVFLWVWGKKPLPKKSQK